MGIKLFHFHWLSGEFLDGLVSLDNDLMDGQSWPKNSWQSFIDTYSSLVIVAFNEINEIIGFLLGRVGPHGDELHILKIAVLSEYRRTGVGHRILDEVFKVGAFQVFLEVNTNNINALKFYEKYGFAKVREIKSFYSNGDNAFFMIKS